MTLRIYNSLTRKVEEFNPTKKKSVSFYACGPTVYNFAHIGNLRAFVFEDILKRVLAFDGYKVKHVMNITDVGHLTSDADTGEDKMEKGAAREGKTAWEIAKFYTDAFFTDLKNLNILPADFYPRATEHIKEQIDLIKKLEEKNFTYKTGDGIYFDTAKLPSYGELAGLKNQSLEAGKRVDLGEKKNPTDFALWKFSKGAKRQMEWQSPWGVGFPGWHIECSAMSVKYLGQPFDIHAGGIDHIPVHHTNEIAQTEAATGKPLANYWVHSEFLLINNGKMAKSGGNFLTLRSLIEDGFSPLAYRYFLLQAHYRKQLNFSREALQGAENGLKHLYEIARTLQPKKAPGDHKLTEQFFALINNDLDTPGAMALIWEALNKKNISKQTLLGLDKVLGLKIKEALKIKPAKIPADILRLAEERDEARSKKDWEQSDRLRAVLEQLGYTVKDSPDGTKVEKK